MNPTLANWCTSSYSGTQGNCVEVAAMPNAVFVRDSKDRTAAELTFTLADWTNFIAGL